MEGIAFASILGAILGSFIATAIVRWPDATALQGRSRCDGCGIALRSSHLIPLISYMRQGGRARCCGHAIDPFHPRTEILAAIVGGLSIFLLGMGGWAAALLGWILLGLALFDLRHFVLPDWLNATLLVAGLAVGVILHWPLQERLIGVVAGYSSLAAVGLVYRWLRKREGLGGGDPKLLAAIGAWLGWEPLPRMMFGAAIIGLAAILIMRARGSAVTATTRLPLGALMAVAAWPTYLFMSLQGRL